MVSVVLRHLTKRFGSIVAVNQANLEVQEGEFLVIVGESGCGKTTTLRLITGLERPDSGTIDIGGVPVNDLPVGQRGVQMIFQNYALWPHMKVFDDRSYSNLSLPLKIRKWPQLKIREFMRICLKHHPVNMGDVKRGSIHQDDIEIDRLIAGQEDNTVAGAVFTDLETLQNVVEELIRADLGICINISGLLDEVRECCQRNGITRHSAEHSLGIWGAKDRLPEREVMEFNTMCGHGMVSFNLIRKMIEQVRLRRMTPQQAARMMAKCCECGSFNPFRAEALLTRMPDRGFLDSQR